MSGIKKTLEKVELLSANFTGETTFEGIDYELSSAVKSLYKFNHGEIQNYLSQKGSTEKPVILLSDEIYRGFAYYHKVTKEIIVLANHFKNSLYQGLKKGDTPTVIVNRLNAKMTYAMLHEMGHFYYYANGIGDLDSSFKAIYYLKKEAKLLTISEAINNQRVKDAILLEAKKTVVSERYADTYAIQEMSEYFPEYHKIYSSQPFLDYLEKCYTVYAADKINQLVQITCLSLNTLDKRTLKRHFKQFTQVDQYV